ncbi:MAG: HAMP domain-containing sensor histidine kinase [Anaeromyxobacter sp.]
MTRRWHLWAVFALCLAGLLAGVGGISLAALRLDRAEAEARRQAALEQDVRLALWRLDAAVAPLLAREGARPARAYAAALPLPERVLAHFQLSPGGELRSPQGAAAAPVLEALRPRLAWRGLLAALGPVPADQASKASPAAAAPATKQRPRVLSFESVESRKSESEYQARQRQVTAMNVQALPPAPAAPSRRPDPPPAPAGEGVMTPVWLGDRLVLLRRVGDGEGALQGCVLDWERIRASLLQEVVDFFPDARLVPAPAAAAPGRRLAALPVGLVPGALPSSPAGDSPLWPVLVATWTLVLLASGAVLALLLGVQRLSERRAAFVSAVTHELRTPLTTFRLYVEMLADGMVPDERRRQEYLETLRREALRLGHLVENVLAFGRVERGRLVRRPEPLGLAALLARHGERLRERAAAAGMSLEVQVPEELVVLGEPGALEQILFNLVDNACKYAAGAQDRRIQLAARREGPRVRVTVRDFGPGIARQDRRRLFVPFSRSAAHAAGAAPGVGLGLALCRSLARSLRGSLELEPVSGPGACFALRLRAGGC